LLHHGVISNLRRHYLPPSSLPTTMCVILQKNLEVIKAREALKPVRELHTRRARLCKLGNPLDRPRRPRRHRDSVAGHHPPPTAKPRPQPDIAMIRIAPPGIVPHPAPGEHHPTGE